MLGNDEEWNEQNKLHFRGVHGEWMEETPSSFCVHQQNYIWEIKKGGKSVWDPPLGGVKGTSTSWVPLYYLATQRCQEWCFATSKPPQGYHWLEQCLDDQRKLKTVSSHRPQEGMYREVRSPGAYH